MKSIILLTDIKNTSSLSGNAATFSLIIDESTDIKTEKSLAIVIKFYSVQDNTVKTKFLCSVNLSSETAENIFDSLRELNLNIENILGFATDTTNVMFGRNNSVVAKIKSVNSNCIFVKCACH